MSVVSWICPGCSTQNAYWRNYCEDCNHPARGYDPRPKPEDDELRRIREHFEEIEKLLRATPSECHGFERPRIDCGCPTNIICMNTACPRAVQVTSYL